MTNNFKENFSLANLIIHFASVVIGIIASLVIASLFIFDARYASKDITTTAISVVAQEVSEARLEHASVELQMRRDISRLEQTNVQSANDRADILKRLSKMQSDIAVLIERTN
ncbi:MAG: hypothetical protein AAF636_11530 [Pseudomonadota bacterium]